MEGNADITSMVLCIGIAEAASLCKAVAEVALPCTDIFADVGNQAHRQRIVDSCLYVPKKLLQVRMLRSISCNPDHHWYS